MRTLEKYNECEIDKKDYENVKIRLAIVESEVEKIEENIEKILSNTNWLVKTIVGGIIATILTFLLKGGGM
ncbi:hypothetical protein CN568_19030 [Bacillus pseudomycoides]|uniref:hemolysin XhlA family protein n=1 Tax=Bacillus pseudomycoides TaxID=64104 RepID=UPI000BF24BDF|nr:hemolysin XhlA family protein [Bacillus pseudomycoides]PEK29385.1 hypothetical protein CN691_21760 [Bacillus pseudomycoides]PEK61553.1 hypothetical protein CN593_26310 [Bacillus pseudomycoides]PEP37372.1 hypothetical protein CN565_27550 [Bacillus pseudomycoides]PEP42354.1 hypothetical protein CN568_19030 [Bacillus pseudomycoides]PFX42733.1 hypothetical protein COL31_27970 [Bacillus pseudomycoides]